MQIKLALVLLALLALVFASACGGDDEDNDSPSPTSDSIGEPAGQPEPGAPTVSMDAPEITVGDQGEAVLTILNFDAPGLGAWTIDIEYDNGFVSVVTCEPLPDGTSVCNPAYTDDTVRIVGASGTGLEGTTVIGRVTFLCDAAGESELNLSIVTLADGTIGAPVELVPFIDSGAINCTE